MLSVAKMNHAHQDPTRDNDFSVFGYDLANAFAPPSPPPTLSNSRGMPLLTTTEADNSMQFLDFFMNNTSGPSNIFNSFDNNPADSLPHFQGMSSTYGRPDGINYDTTMFTNPTLDTTRQFDTTAFFTNRHPMLDTHQTNMASPADIHQRLFPNGLETIPSDPPRQHRRSIPVKTDPTTLGFGSDVAFASRRYDAPPGQDESAVTGKLLAVVDSLELTPSVPNSHPTSPVMTKRKSLKDTQFDSSVQTIANRKRRQSEMDDAQSGGSSDEEGDWSSERKASKGDKPGWTNYRRKSKGKSGDVKRQNLSEKEKRENHIRSEQKRRNQIKEGFANLSTMMPEEWLTGLKEGNERLKAQLLELGGTL